MARRIQSNGESSVFKGDWLLTPQPRLGIVGLTVLLVLINTLIPFSLDIYTPAVPQMPEVFNTTESTVNLTIVGFFVFLAIGQLVFGPVSDRIGRKPVLVGGMALYCVGSAVCALSLNIWVLIGARLFQALGAGAVTAASMAVVKDCFSEKRGVTVLSFIQVMGVIGPVSAPLAGGVILSFASWRMIFWALVVVGGICLALSLLYSESLDESECTHESVANTFGRLIDVMRNIRFDQVLLVAALFNLPFMGYVAVGSYVYVDLFGQSQQVYTYFFAMTALIGAAGPFIFLGLRKHVFPEYLTYFFIVLSLVAGVLLMAMGDGSPFLFMGLMTVYALSESAVRPFLTNTLLYMHDSDTGSASSVINFMVTIGGCAGMGLIMLPFPDYVAGVGILLMVSMVASLVFWFISQRR